MIRARRAATDRVALLVAVALGTCVVGPSRARAQEPPRTGQPDRRGKAATRSTPETRAAKKYFEQGLSYYHDGRYDEAITEFEASYRYQPHANTLHNIGQSYERLLVYPKAVEYFQRYLKEAGPGATYATIVQNRLRALTNLPARLTISSEPPGATVLLRDKAIGKTPLVNASVPAGPATIQLQLPGHVTSTTERTLEIGQPYILQYTLRRQTGVLTVRTRPPGARVLVGDRLVGTTPLSEAVGAGNLQLVLEREGYLKTAHAVTVKPDERTEAELTLVKLPPDRRAGRNELIADAVLAGGWVGYATARVANAKDDQLAALILPAVGGAVAAPLLTALLTRKGDITQGQTQLIAGGTIWGSLQGVYVALAAGGYDKILYAGALGGGTVGLGVSLLVGRRLDVNVNPGDVAMFNSAVFWANGLGALGVGTAAGATKTISSNTAGGIMTGANTAGIVTGILLANFLESTRLRLILIDVTGAVGGLAGFGSAFGLQRNGNERNELLAAGAAAGIVAGLVSGALWTHYLLPRGDDDPGSKRAARGKSSLLARSTGALLAREGGDRGRWKVQVPRPQPVTFAVPGQPGPQLGGIAGFGVGFDLLEPTAW